MNFRSDGQTERARRRAVVVDLTALIDVVFQLLIFFLLTSTYVSQQASAAAQVPVELPESSLAADTLPHTQITISVTADGTLVVDDDPPVGIDELAVRLVKAREDNPRTVVLIRGDQNVAYGRIAAVLAIIRAANLPVSAVLQEGQ